MNEINKININTASIDDFISIPGIGKQLAEEIINSRPYVSMKEIQNIRLMGPKRYAIIKSHTFIQTQYSNQDEEEIHIRNDTRKIKSNNEYQVYKNQDDIKKEGLNQYIEEDILTKSHNEPQVEDSMENISRMGDQLSLEQGDSSTRVASGTLSVWKGLKYRGKLLSLSDDGEMDNEDGIIERRKDTVDRKQLESSQGYSYTRRPYIHLHDRIKKKRMKIMWKRKSMDMKQTIGNVVEIVPKVPVHENGDSVQYRYNQIILNGYYYIASTINGIVFLTRSMLRVVIVLRIAGGTIFNTINYVMGIVSTIMCFAGVVVLCVLAFTYYCYQIIRILGSFTIRVVKYASRIRRITCPSDVSNSQSDNTDDCEVINTEIYTPQSPQESGIPSEVFYQLGSKLYETSS